MSSEKIVILDGTCSAEKHYAPILFLMKDLLKQKGNEVEVVVLRDLRINHCIGCFSCWLKTPGRCIYINDDGPDILQKVLKSNKLILFTPLVFGGYSSELKKVLERFLPMALPFFKKTHGETHHPRRYINFPSIVAIGVHPHPQDEYSRCFRLLVGRNAINADTGYTAEVVNNTDSPDILRSQFQELLFRNDKLPQADALNTLATTPTYYEKISIENRRALLIIGSPKIKTFSTSAVLGGQLLHRLKRYGWKTKSITLQESVLDKKELHKFFLSIEEADTILMACPLYVDSLPYLVTKALELIFLQKECINNIDQKLFFAVINSGLLESYQNALALAICRNFAIACGMTWAGGLTMPAGEGLLSGHSATSFKGLRGRLKRPPLFYVNRALNITAAALAAGRPVPQKAVQMITKQPIPFISFDLWTWIYAKAGERIFQKEALNNGITKEAMYERPYIL